MRFHSNQLSSAINLPFISLCFEYHSPGFICFSAMLAPVISSLDEIYCISPPFQRRLAVVHSHALSRCVFTQLHIGIKSSKTNNA